MRVVEDIGPINRTEPGGGFQYCRLSEEPLFLADGSIRKTVTFRELAEFVWFMETGAGRGPSEVLPLDVRKSSAFPGSEPIDSGGPAADLSGGIAAKKAATAGEAFGSDTQNVSVLQKTQPRRTSSGQAAGDLNKDRTQRVHRFSSGFPRRFAEKLRFSDRLN